MVEPYFWDEIDVLIESGAHPGVFGSLDKLAQVEDDNSPSTEEVERTKQKIKLKKRRKGKKPSPEDEIPGLRHDEEDGEDSEDTGGDAADSQYSKTAARASHRANPILGMRTRHKFTRPSKSSYLKVVRKTRR